MSGKLIAAVASLGAVGSVARLLMVDYFRTEWGTTFPYGVLIVNCMGSFLIGLIFAFATQSNFFSPVMQTAIIVGLIGGFTTFSSFSLDAVLLMQNGEIIKALIYIALSVVVCLMLTFLGLIIGRWCISL